MIGELIRGSWRVCASDDLGALWRWGVDEKGFLQEGFA